MNESAATHFSYYPYNRHTARQHVHVWENAKYNFFHRGNASACQKGYIILIKLPRLIMWKALNKNILIVIKTYDVYKDRLNVKSKLIKTRNVSKLWRRKFV